MPEIGEMYRRAPRRVVGFGQGTLNQSDARRRAAAQMSIPAQTQTLIPGGYRSPSIPGSPLGPAHGQTPWQQLFPLNAGQSQQEPSQVYGPVQGVPLNEAVRGLIRSRLGPAGSPEMQQAREEMRNFGPHGVGGIGYGGGLSQGTVSEINNDVSANRLQAARNAYGEWEHGQLRLRPPAAAEQVGPRHGFLGALTYGDGPGAHFPGYSYVGMTHRFEPGSEAAMNNINFGPSNGQIPEKARASMQAQAQRYKDIVAMRALSQNPNLKNSLAVREAMGRMQPGGENGLSKEDHLYHRGRIDTLRKQRDSLVDEMTAGVWNPEKYQKQIEEINKQLEYHEGQTRRKSPTASVTPQYTAKPPQAGRVAQTGPNAPLSTSNPVGGWNK